MIFAHEAFTRTKSSIIGKDSPTTSAFKSVSNFNADSSSLAISSPVQIGNGEDDKIGLQNTQFDVINAARAIDIAILGGGIDFSGLLGYYKNEQKDDSSNLKSGNTGEKDSLQKDKSTSTSFASILRDITTNNLGNWREENCNGFTKISSRVFLHSDNLPNMGGSITYKLDSTSKLITEGLLGFASGIATAANNFANTIEGLNSLRGKGEKDFKAPDGEYLTQFQQAPYVELKNTTVSGLTEIQFDFKFGQAGLFSGEEEVVKPILALMNIYALQSNSKYPNNVVGPYPTKNYAKARAQAAFISTLLGEGESVKLFGDLRSAWTSRDNLISGGINIANQLAQSLYYATDSAAMASMGDRACIMMIKLGGVFSGPYLPGNITWAFDFNNVDEFGYPTSGNIKFSDMKPMLRLSGRELIAQWSYGNINLKAFYNTQFEDDFKWLNR